MADPFGLCPETNEAPSKFAFLHTALDIVGVFWDGADLINAGLYLAEGDYENAVISVVSAIPLVGSAVGTGVKLFTKENLLCAANAALGVVAGVAAAKGIKSDVKAFKKIAGVEKAAESAAKTSQRVAADAESQLEKTAERTETTNPCTCKGNGQCFVAGTIIKTKDGEKNIEDVEIEDYVLARNLETGEQEYKKVSETFTHKEDVIIHVQIGMESRKIMDYQIKDILINNANIVTNYNWEKIENENNIVFPEDYKWFLENYGSGSINDFLWIFSPTCNNLNLNSFEQYKVMKNSYEIIHNNKLIEYDYSFYDNGIGLFPWGITDNGDELYWNYVNGVAEIVIFASRYADVFSCKLNMIDFLTGLLTKKIECDIFPDDFVLDNNYYGSIE